MTKPSLGMPNLASDVVKLGTGSRTAPIQRLKGLDLENLMARKYVATSAENTGTSSHIA